MDEQSARWTARLRAWGLDGLAAAMLESAGPLAFLGAQALHVLGPGLSLLELDGEAAGLAHLLENPAAMQELMDRLNAKEAVQ